jgi:hypothetical protein
MGKEAFMLAYKLHGMIYTYSIGKYQKHTCIKSKIAYENELRLDMWSPIKITDDTP